jgi:ubiquinone/menaquinone biosynthesis C-methylase UbiE
MNDVKIESVEKQYWDSTEHTGMQKRDVNHTVIEFYAKQRFDYIQTKIPLNSIQSCLDIGAGTGFSSIHFPNPEIITSSDYSYRNLKMNPSKNKIQASAYSLPFDSNSFDLVYGWEFLHHLDEPEKAVSEMSRVSKKFLILFEPNSINPALIALAAVRKEERRILQYNRKKMIKLVNSLNYDIISCESVGWIFTGVTPIFSLKLFGKLPFVHKFGVAWALICKKK